MSNGNEFLAVVQQNGANALLNMANVARITERDHGLDGAQVVYTDGTTLQIRDDFNALALRLAFLPVPPRSREQMPLMSDEEVAEWAGAFETALTERAG